MLNNKRFREVHLIYKGNGFLVYKGYDLETKQYVALKTVDPESSNLIAEDILNKEFHILKHINDDQVVEPLDLIKGLPSALVLKFIDGLTLRQLIAEDKLTYEEKLDITISLVKALQCVHKHDVIHKDINPANIIWHPYEQKVYIIDFNLSEIVKSYHEVFAIESNLKGTLPYISPEQTGRLNRNVDYRTDIYSLGITLYELFTGQVPFKNNDYLGIIHAHIARMPKEPLAINQDLPQILSKMIMTLLEKNPEERYCSLDLLEEDLLKVKNKETDFEIKTSRETKEYKLIDAVYGREREINELNSVFEKTLEGYPSIAWISGYSGIGKTTIVKTLFKPLTISKGYFLDGKYDQFSKHQPYAVLRSIFSSFFTQLSFEGLENVQKWLDLVKEKLGSNLSIIINIIPELESLFDLEDEDFGLTFQELENRLKRAIKQFISTLANENRPIIVFIDDLQWADSPTIELIEYIMQGGGIANLMLIGAYRSNEVGASHRLMQTFDINHDALIVSHIKVSQLHVRDMIKWLEDSFGDTEQDIISGLVKKTNGNPFYMKQLIKQISDENLVIYDETSNQWIYPTDLFDHLDIYDNVAAILSKQLDKLPTQVKDILALAACMGSVFNKSSLMKIAALDLDSLDTLFYFPLLEGYISKRDTGTFAFGHDQIQQASYNLVDEDDIRKNHLKIYQHIKTDSNDLIEIARHILAAKEWANEIDRNEQLNVFYKAGVHAFNNIAYQEAQILFQAALDLNLSLENHYDVTVQIYNYLGQTYYLLGLFDQLDDLRQKVQNLVEKPSDISSLYDVGIHSYLSRLMHQEGLELAIEALNAFGIDMSLQVTPEMYGQAMSRLAEKMNGRQIEDLIHLDITNNKEIISIMQMLTGLVPLLFNTAPQLLLLVFIEMIILSLDHGNCKYSAYGYAFYGTVISGNMGMIEEGIKYAKVALKLIDNMSAVSEIPKINMVTAQHVLFYEIHPNESITLLEKGYDTGIEIGDYTYAGFAGHGICFMSFLAGRQLAGLRKAFIKYSNSFEEINQQTQLLFQRIYQEAIDILINKEDNCRFEGEWFNEETMLDDIITRNHRTGAFVYYYLKTYLLLTYQSFDQAYDMLIKLQEYLDGGTGLMHASVFHQFSGIIHLNKTHSSQAELDSARDSLTKLDGLKDSINFKHRYLLLSAEIKRKEQDYIRARELYDLALQETIKHKFVADEALCREFMSHFYKETDRNEMYRYYKKSAYDAYVKWGALGKAKSMYSDAVLNSTQGISDKTIPSSSKTFGYSLLTQLDLQTILKVSRIIAKEINIENMMKKSLSILLENAGATRTAMISRVNDDKWLMAMVDLDNQSHFSYHDSLASMNLPHSIINYVLSKKDALHIGNTLEDDYFKDDEYIIKHKVQSLFAYPLINQGEMIGLLYLENNQTSYVFSEDRTSFIEHIAVQIAISLRNALTYSHLEELVKQRTEDLNTKNLELLNLNNKLHNLSITDTLTGAYNRRKIEELLQDANRQFKRYGNVFSVILLDVDNFKRVNDTYGHNVGDEVLVKISQTLNSNIREVDALARWGGEEFLIICPNTNRQMICDLALKLRKIIENTPFETVGQMTCSFGTATIKENMPLKDLLKYADQNMYEAKEAGRNKVKCSD